MNAERGKERGGVKQMRVCGTARRLMPGDVLF